MVQGVRRRGSEVILEITNRQTEKKARKGGETCGRVVEKERNNNIREDGNAKIRSDTYRILWIRVVREREGV